MIDSLKPRATSRRTLLRSGAIGGLAATLSGALPKAAARAAERTAAYTPGNRFFNAHHAPIGAYSTFTLGYPGASGGFGIEQKLPGTQSVFVGVLKDGVAHALPFFDAAAETGITAYAQSDVSRDFRASSDRFETADFSFTLFSPVRSVPDPNKPGLFSTLGHGPLTGLSTSGRHSIEDALLPAIFAELMVDNSKGSTAMTAAFAVSGGTAQQLGLGVPGVVFGADPVRTAIVTDDRDAVSFTAASMSAALSGGTGAGPVGGIAVTVPAGTRKTIRFALCFHHAGDVTTGRVTRYWYTRYYDDIRAVALAAAQTLRQRVASFAADDRLVDQSSLSANQKFLLAQAIRSYYGNTAFLYEGTSTPWWVVMEGQYQYMNTFDLTVDQLFFELGMNPWTVKNELDNFVSHYSYQSGTELVAGSATPTGPGGISFTHDMGQWPAFSADGSSNYERSNVFGTFSFMTGEQLTNWLLIAGVYSFQTGDLAWVERNASIFSQALTSLLNRDNGVASARDGIESYNSTKTGTGEEITTYDSVGAGLEEAVGNTYLAGKCFSAYVVLEGLLTVTGRPDLALQAAQQAQRIGTTLLQHVTSQGFITSNVYDGSSIAIIPVVEGLVYSYFAGRKDAVSANGPHGALIRALKRHLTTVLDTGLCITTDGGWKLDSQSDNTWLSKIFLNEFVGRQVLGLNIRASTNNADAASVQWLTNATSAKLAFSDQIIDGVAIGSEYYPRGVTAILWLQEPRA
ncbi:glycoside hydrolase family 52 protein [Acetobacteraceae bacterium KSS8]|uniref:Glycoside hydrolase family 52 protein n=1 Tax=Endosaccharibacter trunci TaxID=2812733 RepID=A0ABT1W7W0_9PROT|nr:glycoside hydrolase family 52 protein [Acetobacteraceae bacterium KSS8]